MDDFFEQRNSLILILRWIGCRSNGWRLFVAPGLIAAICGAFLLLDRETEELLFQRLVEAFRQEVAVEFGDLVSGNASSWGGNYGEVEETLAPGQTLQPLGRHFVSYIAAI